jgi:hypothetical protein
LDDADAATGGFSAVGDDILIDIQISSGMMKSPKIDIKT